MEEYLKNESDHRREQLGVLEGLEGYRKLSKKQQQIVRLSLYAQQRRDRRWSVSGNYDRAKALDDRAFCHLAVYHLENELSLNKEPPIRLNDAGVLRRSQFLENESPLEGEIMNKVREAGYPCSIIICEHVKMHLRDTNEILDARAPLHTCVALGERHGKMIVWEKESRFHPFSLLPFSDVVARFEKESRRWPKCYALRPFSSWRSDGTA